MGLPVVTHLQWLVLKTLLYGEQPGCRIRESLSNRGVTKSGPAFYQLMARLEQDGLVSGHYERSMEGNQPIKERHYKLTSAGRKSVKETAEFYGAE